MHVEQYHTTDTQDIPDDPWFMSASLRKSGLGKLLNGSGVVAGLLSCLLPLIVGIGSGWGFGRTAAYTALAILFLVLTGVYLLSADAADWLSRRISAYLLTVGIILTGLQSISGDPTIQPIGFTVPFVIALLCLSPRRAIFTGLFYLGLAILGLWLSGLRTPSVFLLPTTIYGAIMFFMYAIIRIALEQDSARRTAARLAAQNARLAREAQLSATLAERNRIARELHDTIAQGLTALTMQLEAVQRGFDHDPERARARLVRAHELARATLADVRRSVWTLAAPIAENEALDPLLAEQVCQFSGRSGVFAEYVHSGSRLVLPSEQAIQVLRILQEALQNVEKHARAANVHVRSHADETGMTMSIIDDGIGFDPTLRAGDTQRSGFGLMSMNERARLAGGEIHVTSAPGQGTTVLLRMPAAHVEPTETNTVSMVSKAGR